MLIGVADVLTQSFKASEILLGIETDRLVATESLKIRFKASETLLGIETKPILPRLSGYHAGLQSL